MGKLGSGSSTPREVRVQVSTGAGVDIVWADGHQSHYDFDYLRQQCPCALCTEERQRRPTGTTALPLYRPRTTARSAAPVGHYGLEFVFSDGHSAGIYTYAYLRDLCPCPQCRQEATAPARPAESF